MKGLTENASEILDCIADFDFLSDYTFIGGSALAVQIGHRKSEDLDFCKWKVKKNIDVTINTISIEKSIASIGIKDKNIYDFNHIDYYLKNKVKLSFYANNLYKSPVTKRIHIKGKIFAPDIITIGAMKLELMLRRSKFRDYYDIYSILKEGINIFDMVYLAVKYSNHKLKSKNIISFITNAENYRVEKDFNQLNPLYQVNGKDIERFIKEKVSMEHDQI